MDDAGASLDQEQHHRLAGSCHLLGELQLRPWQIKVINVARALGVRHLSQAKNNYVGPFGGIYGRSDVQFFVEGGPGNVDDACASCLRLNCLEDRRFVFGIKIAFISLPHVGPSIIQGHERVGSWAGYQDLLRRRERQNFVRILEQYNGFVCCLQRCFLCLGRAEL